MVLRGVAQAAAGGARLAQQGRGVLHPRRHIDPFGAVAAVIAGVGWGTPTSLTPGWRGKPTRQAMAVLAGPIALVLIGLVVVAVYRGLGGAPADIRLSSVLLGDIPLRTEFF